MGVSFSLNLHIQAQTKLQSKNCKTSVSECSGDVQSVVISGFNRVAPDFGSGSGKSEIRPFLPNPAKSGSGQISSRIWRMPLQL